MDRNFDDGDGLSLKEVALPTEGVDRNQVDTLVSGTVVESPSPRRAWIEI